MSRALHVRLLLVALMVGAFAVMAPSVAFGQDSGSCEPDPTTGEVPPECQSAQAAQSGEGGSAQGGGGDGGGTGGGQGGSAEGGGGAGGIGTDEPAGEEPAGEEPAGDDPDEGDDEDDRRVRVTFRDLDCHDFSSQAHAQAVLNRNTNDPHALDTDNDGFACENFFVRRVVVSRVLARTGPHALEVALAGGLCLLGSLALRRRRISSR
jgi:hypothetical protein